MSLDKIKEVIYNLQQQVRGLPVHRYGTITALEPLTLVLDGERGTIYDAYKNCAVKVGDRVSCLRQGTQTIILAVVGGGDPNVVVVGGVVYEASGVIEVSSTAPFTAYAPIYSRILSVPAPYQPPPGWDFQVTTYTSGNRICLFNLDAPTVSGVMTVRHLQVANSTVGTGASFLWRLCHV